MADAYTIYGALDSTAVADGSPVSAHVLRAMGKAANRLATRTEHLFSIVWPQDSETTENQPPHTVAMRPQWQALTPPITIPKKPGVTTGEFKMRARIPGAQIVEIQLATLARQFNPSADANSQNYGSFTADGDNDVDQYSITAIDLHHGPFEVVQIWCRCEGDYGTASEVTYGPENKGTLVLGTDLFGADFMKYTSAGTANYNTAIDNGQVMIVWVDGSNNPVVSPRVIVYRQSSTELHWEPMLTAFEQALCIGAGLNFELWDLPRWEPYAFSLAGVY